MSSQITYVSGYFELPDTGRNFETYLERASKFSLKIPHPMIIFCEPHTFPRIKEERSKYGYLTHYVVKKIDELEFFSYLPQIIENRKTHPRADPRNTPEYQCITCSKYTMVRDAINKNIFGSQYYVWVDFGLVESEYSNILSLRAVSNNIISNKRENVRMCFINYTPLNETLNLENYYHMYGRCGIAGTLFSGSSTKLLSFMEMCIKCFKDTVAKGYGHADEQIYLQVLFSFILEGNKINDLFDFYFGDYQYILSNYPAFNSPDAKNITLNAFLPNVIKDKAKYPECKELVSHAVMYLMDGYKKGKLELSKEDIFRLFEYVI